MVVLDASVILKWTLPETDSAAALGFRDRHVAGEEQIIVPPLLFYEVANALRYQDKVQDSAVEEFFDALEELELLVVEQSPSAFIDVVLDAREMGLSVYDASYVALARQVGSRLITADRKLVEAVNDPRVQLLRSE